MPAHPSPAAIAESLTWLRTEQDAIALYEALAAIDKDPGRSAAFSRIAAAWAPPGADPLHHPHGPAVR